MDYEVINEEHMLSILRDRLGSHEQEYFQHTINYKVGAALKKSIDKNTQQVGTQQMQAANHAMKQLEGAMEVVKKEIKPLEAKVAELQEEREKAEAEAQAQAEAETNDLEDTDS